MLTSTHSSDDTLPTDSSLESPILVIEKGGKETEGEMLESTELDIEHLPVQDDPRLWSRGRKTGILAVIALSAMAGTITANIYFPAIASLQSDLNASDELIAASVSLFILVQGVAPMGWSALSEIRGRRISYITSMAIYVAATAVCSRANDINLFIVMRVVQAMGSSSVLSLGAGTLADIYDTEERGTKLGLYYGVPLLGPSLGSLIGGALTSVSSWRSTFYFLLGYGVICVICLIWLPETFRKERSFAYRQALDRARLHAKQDLAKADMALPNSSQVQLPSSKNKAAFSDPTPSRLELGTPLSGPILSRIRTTLSMKTSDDLKIHFRDVNPFAAIGLVLRQKHNFLAVLYSGSLFASQYSVSFSASRSFADAPYNYGPLNIGLVLLSFGVGNIVGSLGGGKYSDIVLKKLKLKNGGVSEPEMRIKSTYIAMCFVPPFFLAYAWLVQKEVAIVAIVIVLFVIGLTSIWIYSSTLAYIVDSNPGRSSSAVAANSLFRGVLAAIAAQVAGPAVDGIGNGWYYTIFAFVLFAGQAGLVLVSWRGKAWRARYRGKEEKEEKEKEQKEKEAASIELK